MLRFVLPALLMLGSAALAQGAPPPATPMKPMAPPAASADTPGTAAYKQAMEAMMQGMDIPYTGDADRDFVQGMLPHHQGAVDMAKIELRYGRDPALRRLARDVVAAQTKEQAFMRQWLANHPGKQAAR